MDEAKVIWTQYMKYRLRLRGFDASRVEEILRYSPERYFDVVTGRMVAVGNHEKVLVAVPYERGGETITPVTIHASNRRQIEFRLKSGRYKNE